MQFHELGINEVLLQALKELGFTQPTAIQEQSIPLLLQHDRDYIGLAQTGTGKTAAFGLPLIQLIKIDQRKTQAIVLCPTRELCVQITKELKSYAQHVDRLVITAVYGGVAFNEQVRALRAGSHIVVGTPGRVLDHIKRGTLTLDSVQTAVLDEADEMLNMGFQEDITAILSATPTAKRTWLFSATMSSQVETIAKRYMKDPYKVTVGTRNSTASNITHHYCIVANSNMYHALKRFIDYYPTMLGILFCRTRQDARDLTERLTHDGYDADALHGDLSQVQRDAVMERFRAKKLQLLIATDVAARGIDVDGITHVFHYHIPDDSETYTHRSGRTARAGKSGMTVAMLTPRDFKRVRILERTIGTKISHLPIPGAQDIMEQQINHCIQTIQTPVPDAIEYTQYLTRVMQACTDVSKEDLLKRILMTNVQRLTNTKQYHMDLNVQPLDVRLDRYSGQGERAESSSSSSSNRLFINVGSIDGLDKGSFLHMLVDLAQVNKNSIGTIALKSNFTFFDVADAQTATQLIDSLSGQTWNNRKIRIELSSDRPMGTRRPYGRSDQGQGRSSSSERPAYGSQRPTFRRRRG